MNVSDLNYNVTCNVYINTKVYRDKGLSMKDQIKAVGRVKGIVSAHESVADSRLVVTTKSYLSDNQLEQLIQNINLELYCKLKENENDK